MAAESADLLGELIAAEIAAHLPPGAAPFDVHAHTGIDVDGSSRSCDEHVADLERLGGRSAIFPLCVETGYAAENRRVLAECARHGDRLVPFARIDPRAGRPGAAARAALADGARGLKLHPRSERFRLDHPGVDAVLAAAAEARAPVVVHAGLGVGSLGTAIVTLARRHRDCPIVLAHAGISDLGWLWPRLDEHPNLLFDTAWWNPADLLALFARVAPGRILWGSDAPYGDVALGLAIALRCARAAGLSGDAIALVAGGQLRSLLDGAGPVDAGPAPGPAAVATTPEQGRALACLTGIGGCLIAGADPAGLVELARVAIDDPLLAELAALATGPPLQARAAVVLALTLAATPGLAEAADGRQPALGAA